LLLHLVDLCPLDPEADPARDARAILRELRAYDPELYAKPRWLVLNKIDSIPVEERAVRIAEFVKRLRGRGRSILPIDPERVYAISALTREGCERLCFAIHDWLESQRVPAVTEHDIRFDGPHEPPPRKPALPRKPRTRSQRQ
jgi:GTP-binding protein